MGQENGRWYLEYLTDTLDGKRERIQVLLNGVASQEEAMAVAVDEWDIIKEQQSGRNPESGHLVCIIPLLKKQEVV